MLFPVISKIQIWQLCLSLFGRPDQLWSMFLCGACFLQKWKRMFRSELNSYQLEGEIQFVIFFLTKKHFWWFSSVQSLSHVWLFVTPWIAAHQASLSITNPWSLLKLMPIELVMPSSHFILYRSLLLLPPIPPRIRVFFNESTLCMRWLKYWSFSFFHLFWFMNFNICVKVKSEVSQSCLTLCDLMDYSVHAILQARILERLAILFTRGSSQPRPEVKPRSPALQVDSLPAEPPGKP